MATQEASQLNVKPYEAKFTSRLCKSSRYGNKSYDGFTVLKTQKYFHKLWKIREATFYLPTKTGVPLVLEAYTTDSYHRACTEIRFTGKDLTKFREWLDPKVRGIDWPRNKPHYYEAEVITQNKNGSKVEIHIKSGC